MDNNETVSYPITLEEMLKYQRRQVEERLELRIRKAHDYATDNWLSNFERRAKLFDILSLDTTKSYGIAFGDMILKIDRISNILFRKKGEVMNESLCDSLQDLRNYIDLMEECLMKEGILVAKRYD